MGTSEVVITGASVDLGKGTKDVVGHIGYLQLSPLPVSRSYGCPHCTDEEIQSLHAGFLTRAPAT